MELRIMTSTMLCVIFCTCLLQIHMVVEASSTTASLASLNISETHTPSNQWHTTEAPNTTEASEAPNTTELSNTTEASNTSSFQETKSTEGSSTVKFSNTASASIITTTVTTTEDVTTSGSKPSTAQAIPETTIKQQTTTVQTTTSVNTEGSTKAAKNCMKARAKEFQNCLESLGKNAMQYIATSDLTGFLDDICDLDRSKPHVECIKRHFRECPDFLERPEVKALEFGPYHIKDIHYFDTIDQMCRCSNGLVCINKLLETKVDVNLTLTDLQSPWTKMPNFKAICEYDTTRYIGCVRQNLRRCQTALNRRYRDEFTYNDAEDLKGMYDFIKGHCDEVNDDDFEENYRCIHEASRSSAMHACVRRADSLKATKKTCEIRECVRSVLESECDDDMVSLYIDAVNIYTHSSTKLLNFPCSSAADIGISIVTVIFTFLFVLYY